jgi:hypothetical protein
MMFKTDVTRKTQSAIDPTSFYVQRLIQTEKTTCHFWNQTYTLMDLMGANAHPADSH